MPFIDPDEVQSAPASQATSAATFIDPDEEQPVTPAPSQDDAGAYFGGAGMGTPEGAEFQDPTFMTGALEKTAGALKQASQDIDQAPGDNLQKLIPALGGTAMGIAGGLTMIPDAVAAGLELGASKLGMDFGTPEEIMKKKRLTAALGVEAATEWLSQTSPVAKGVMEGMAAPFVAISEQAGEEYGAGGKIVADAAMALLPFVGLKAKVAKARADFAERKAREASVPVSEDLKKRADAIMEEEAANEVKNTPETPEKPVRTPEDEAWGERTTPEDKAAAFDDLEKANAEWKAMTEEKAWEEHGPYQASERSQADMGGGYVDLNFENTRGTTMAVAMDEAMRKAAEEKKPMPDAFKEAIEEGVAHAVENSPGLKGFFERTVNWVKEGMRQLVGEDTARGEAVRLKLMKDAVTEMEAAAAKSDAVAGSEAIRVAAAKDYAKYSSSQMLDGGKAYALAMHWVSRTLPRMFGLATGGVYAISFRKFAKLSEDFKLNQLAGGDLYAIAEMKKVSPEFLEKAKAMGYDDPGQFADIIYRHTRGKDINTNAYAFPAAKTPWVIFNIDRINSTYRGKPIHLAAILVHELTHIKHRQKKGGPMDLAASIEARSDQVGYWDSVSERYARHAEEGAFVKFGALMEKELRRMGIEGRRPTETAYNPKSKGAVPRTVVTSMELYREGLPLEGAVGPARGGTMRSAPKVTKGPNTEHRLGGRPHRAFTEAQLASIEGGPEINIRHMIDEIFAHTDENVRTGEKTLGEVRRWWKENDIAGNINKMLIDFPDMATERLIELIGPLGEDIRMSYGLRSGTYSGVSRLLASKDVAKKSAIVALHFITKIKNAVANEHAANFRLAKQLASFEAYYGQTGTFAGWVKNKAFLNNKVYEKFAKDVRIALDFELNPKDWFNGKDWYPSVEQLIAKGMSPESAGHWRKMFDHMENMWGKLEATIVANGGTMVKRIPGYLPHQISGAYRVKAYRVNSNGQKVYVADAGAHTMKEAQQLHDLIKQSVGTNPDIFVEKPTRPQIGKVEMSTILDGLKQASQAAENIKGLSKLAEILQQQKAKGIILPALKRGTVTKWGHTLDRATMYGQKTGLHYGNMKEAITIFRDYAREVNAWHERSKLINEVLIPLEASDMLRGPNLRRLVGDHFNDFVGIREASRIDNAMRDFFAQLGWSPNALLDVVTKMQGHFAKFYLLANPSFYVVNGAQATASFPIMLQQMAKLQLANERTPNMGTAVSKGTARLKNAFTEAGLLRDKALQWGEEHGFLDPTAIEVVDPAQFNDPITRGIDQRTRRIAFAYGYEFWKQIRPEAQALRLAGEFANEVSVAYNKQVGAPGIMNRIPVVGRAASMFMSYSMHVMSMLEQQLQLTRQAIKSKNPKAAISSLGAMTSYAGLQLALFGTMATPLASAINSAIQAINDLFGKSIIPTYREVARAADKAMGTKGLVEFGIISSATGIDISGSASGVTPQAPSAYTRAVATYAEAALIGGKLIASLAYKDLKPTDQEIYDLVKNLPPQWRGIAERAIRKHPDTQSRMDVHEKGNPRTKAEQMISWLGLKSTRERASMYSEQMAALEEKRITAKMSKILERYKDDGMSPEVSRKLTELAIEYQKDPETVWTAYFSWLETQNLTPDQRRALRAIESYDAMGRYKREQAIQQTETTR